MENRSIKFRQFLQNSKWHYWGFVDGGFVAPVTSEGIDEAHKWSQEYTNLKDKNGKEIYEGDIISYQKYARTFRGKKPSGWQKFEVKRTNHALVANGWNLRLRMLPIYEVIGNIYENPELLK